MPEPPLVPRERVRSAAMAACLSGKCGRESYALCERTARVDQSGQVAVTLPPVTHRAVVDAEQVGNFRELHRYAKISHECALLVGGARARKRCSGQAREISPATHAPVRWLGHVSVGTLVQPHMGRMAMRALPGNRSVASRTQGLHRTVDSTREDGIGCVSLSGQGPARRQDMSAEFHFRFLSAHLIELEEPRAQFAHDPRERDLANADFGGRSADRKRPSQAAKDACKRLPIEMDAC